ncbi:MAG: VWA domain-containing protein [Kiritimatiellae bacterium]|nr:VWA domain-containing protein [Kiritimatiellia bacterium]MDD5520106.1 VWA domain-containing protein [Kiritimatiellia bacterium]
MNTQVQFVNVWVLYLLWLVPVLAWWWHASAKRMENRLSSFMSAEMQKKLRPQSSRLRHMWQTGLITSGMFLLFLSMARPQWGIREEKIYQRGRDLIIALDVSRSMLANDVHPNRLQRAKTDVMDLIKELRGDRAALLAFRKKAVMLCPLTTDYAYLRQALDATTIDSAPVGETDIGDAIIKAMDIFKSDEGSHKAIILISDGEDLTGKALTAAEEAGKKNIPIFTVGLGSSNGSKIPDNEKSRSFFKHKGEDIVTKLNDKTMHAIAEATRGAYIPVGTASMTSTTLGMLYRDHLSKLSAQDIEETLQRRYMERFQLFLLPAFLLMLAGTFLSRGRLASSSRSHDNFSVSESSLKDLTPPAKPLKNLALILTVSLTLALTSVAQTTNLTEKPNAAQPADTATNVQATIKVPPGREGARIAQKYYLMGKYNEAAGAYLEALRGASDKSQQDFRYNAAVALFNAGKFKEAADILKDLFQKGKTGETDFAMGLGASLYRAAESAKKADAPNFSEQADLMRESGEAFKEAAKSDPANKQCRQNLAVVLEVLPSLQEQAKTAELMAQYDQVPAQQIADQMLQNQRQITSEIPPAFTNDSPGQIQMLETIAQKQKDNTDLWIPLKGKLLNSMAQQQAKDPKIQQQVAAFEQLVEATRTYMKDASSALRDIDTAGYNSAVVSETGIYQFWKSIAAYHSLLQEDIRRQTNTITMISHDKQMEEAQRKMIKTEQDEALSLTDIFAKRFSETIPESGTTKETVPQAKEKVKNKDENKAAEEDQTISAETRRKILELATQATTTQKSAAGLIEKNDLSSSLREQRKAHDILKEIEKLLPKNKSQNQQDQKQKQDKQDQQQEQNKKQDDQQQKQQSQQQQEQQKQQSAEQKEQKQEKNNKEELTAEQLKKMLEKAAQRENEHETKKRERNRSIPLSPIDRDW